MISPEVDVSVFVISYIQKTTPKSIDFMIGSVVEQYVAYGDAIEAEESYKPLIIITAPKTPYIRARCFQGLIWRSDHSSRSQ